MKSLCTTILLILHPRTTRSIEGKMKKDLLSSAIGGCYLDLDVLIESITFSHSVPILSRSKPIIHENKSTWPILNIFDPGSIVLEYSVRGYVGSYSPFLSQISQKKKNKLRNFKLVYPRYKNELSRAVTEDMRNATAKLIEGIREDKASALEQVKNFATRNISRETELILLELKEIIDTEDVRKIRDTVRIGHSKYKKLTNVEGRDITRIVKKQNYKIYPNI